jgi:hypothetical protein
VEETQTFHKAAATLEQWMHKKMKQRLCDVDGTEKRGTKS